MREVLFKDLTSIRSKKKDILLKEMFERDGIVAKTERRSFYFIKNVNRIDEPNDLQKWINTKETSAGMPKRSFHILKEHNDSAGEDKVIFKISGMFYAVVDNNVYTIAFMHSFKVKFMKATIAK